MPRCCVCNSVGTCTRCSCVSNDVPCSDCIPGARGRCGNRGVRHVDPGFDPGGGLGRALPSASAALASVVCEVGPSLAGGASESSQDPDSGAGDVGGSSSSRGSSSSLGALSCAEENDHSAFVRMVDSAYEVVVHWRRNLFIVPFGEAGSAFVEELARLIQGFADGTHLRGVAWKAVSVACHLLLQKPHDSRLMNDHPGHLRRRLSLWRAGDVATLFSECVCIQRHLPARARFPDQGLDSDGISDTKFSKLVYHGKIRSAVQLVCSGSAGGVLGLNDFADGVGGRTVRDVLLDKHPSPAEPPPDVLMDTSLSSLSINHVLFERLTPELIKRIGREMHGSSGPSGLDSEVWKRMLTCYNRSSNRLCSALAAAARCLCTEELSGSALSAFTAARLIPLDKCPGVRPIAVGEVFRRLVCRAIARVIEFDLMSATAPLQLCVGVPSACEAAVHAMRRLYQRPTTQAILLVDASNAFNTINRIAALHNIPLLCPALGQVFQNTYQSSSRLFVAGGDEILSREGTCQGDPLAMAIYAVAVMPLINSLAAECSNVMQSWYADDASGAGSVSDLHVYWRNVLAKGPGYGYHPNPAKTVLLAKPAFLEEAHQCFAGTGVKIVSNGCRYLGGVLGSDDFCHEYLMRQIFEWQRQVQRLADLGATQPHAAYTVFVKGILSKWQYLLRACDCAPDLLHRLDELINERLLPALAGQQMGADSPIRKLIAMPTRFGGLGMPVVAGEVDAQHKASIDVTQPIVDLLVPPDESAGSEPSLQGDSGTFGTQSDAAIDSSMSSSETSLPGLSPTPQIVVAVGESRKTARKIKKDKNNLYKSCVGQLRPALTPAQQFLTEIAGEKGVSTWLTAYPAQENGTVLNKSDFRDAICVRYDFPIGDLPTTCVCGADMSLGHAMCCPCGGYPTARHNEVRDVLAGILQEVVRDVEIEPRLLPFQGESLTGRTANRSSEARVDIRAGGFWTRQQDAFFDVRVTYPKAVLLSRREALSQLSDHEREKKRQYAERINVVDRGAFTPLVFSTTGMAGRECSMFLKSLVSMIVEKNVDLKYSVVMNRLRCKLSFCLLRWCITCLRGCRSSYRKHRNRTFISECLMST